MSSADGEYKSLLDRFLGKEISAEKFQSTYLDLFKKETRRLDAPVFELLDGLFGDVDAFTTDPHLLAENPGFYLDEEGLTRKARLVADRLSHLKK